MHDDVTIAATVVALAGRRVDAVGTHPPRFPPESIPVVRKRLTELFTELRVVALICSAACGADLIALEEAERLGLRFRIVLPFPPERFRETSVLDRPGAWGPVFDRLIAAASASNDLIVLNGTTGDDETAYAAANEAIVREALALSKVGVPLRRLAVVVWEGSARSGSDATESFRRSTKAAGFEERSVATL